MPVADDPLQLSGKYRTALIVSIEGCSIGQACDDITFVCTFRAHIVPTKII